MVTDFQDRLRQLRAEKDRETQEKREQDSSPEDRLSSFEVRFDHREKIEKVILGFGEKFLVEVPSFSLSKSFFEGKYKIELTCDDLLIDEQGHVDKYFSRITFFLDPSTWPVAMELGCKKTVRNRDQESATLSVEATEESLASLQTFVEEQFFQFASTYFSNSLSAAPTP